MRGRLRIGKIEKNTYVDYTHFDLVELGEITYEEAMKIGEEKAIEMTRLVNTGAIEYGYYEITVMLDYE